jgi:hypothetical protein
VQEVGAAFAPPRQQTAHVAEHAGMVAKRRSTELYASSG